MTDINLGVCPVCRQKFDLSDGVPCGCMEAINEGCSVCGGEGMVAGYPFCPECGRGPREGEEVEEDND